MGPATISAILAGFNTVNGLAKSPPIQAAQPQQQMQPQQVKSIGELLYAKSLPTDPANINLPQQQNMQFPFLGGM